MKFAHTPVAAVGGQMGPTGRFSRVRWTRANCGLRTAGEVVILVAPAGEATICGTGRAPFAQPPASSAG
jgi:hypothetical protein